MHLSSVLEGPSGILRVPRTANQWLKGFRRSPEEAVRLLEALERHGCRVTCFHYSTVISGCGGDWPRALHLLEAMGVRTIGRDTVVYNSAMSACARGGQWALALVLLTRLPQERLVPDSLSLNGLIASAPWPVGLQLLQQEPVDVVSFNAAMKACSGARQWRMSLRLLQRLQNTLAPDVVSYTVALAGLETSWRTALQLLEDMATTLQGDCVAYTAAVAVCGRAARWAEALAIVSGLEGLRCDVATYNALLTALGNGLEPRRTLEP